MHFFTFKQEVHHFGFEQFAMFWVHHIELFLVDQHGLFMLPLSPSFFGNGIENTFTQLAG